MAESRTLILAGPTAVGKTELSLKLARRLSAEIISADSRQIFRYMDIGTAKPGPGQRNQVPHHFIDELDPGDPFSAGAFARAAIDRIADIHHRGMRALVVGGATLYIQALQFGLADIPPVSPDVRRHLTERLASEGSAALYQELQRVDPRTAASADPTKTQRIVRALEVHYGTGRPLSYWFDSHVPPPFPFRTFVLTRPRPVLNERIDARVDAMIQEGLVNEVKDLLARGVDPNWNALQTIGYQEPIAFLNGQIDHDEMVRQIKLNTRRYAKRQLTWYRRFPEYEWIDLETADSSLVEQLAKSVTED